MAKKTGKGLSDADRIRAWMTEYVPERTVLSAAKAAGSVHSVMDLDKATVMSADKRVEHIRNWAERHGG